MGNYKILNGQSKDTKGVIRRYKRGNQKIPNGVIRRYQRGNQNRIGNKKIPKG